jgi:hypothetical protein
MIIKLKENKTKFLDKIRNKYPEIKKEKGENILMVGCTGCGKSESMLSLYKLLFLEGYIEDRSIILSIYGDNSIYAKWISILAEHKKRDITKKDFSLFNLMDEKERETFNQINFKSSAVQKILNKHTMFLVPALESSIATLSHNINKQFYDFLKNLPINTGKEIPILITDIYLLSKNNYRRYSKVAKELNKKGYFFITTIEGYPESIDYSLPILKETFKHMLIMRTESYDEKLKSIFDKIDFKTNVRNLNAGEYYYLKDFKITNKNKKSLPYLPAPMVSVLPDYERFDKLLLINKIQGF